MSRLIQIASFSTRVQADLARMLIEAEGLTALLFDQEVNYAFGAFMPVRLMVPNDEAEEALRLLAEEGLL